MFLGTTDRVYLVDKTENNPHIINSHPAWASEWSISSSQARPMDVITNSFCAVSLRAKISRWLCNYLSSDHRVVACWETARGSMWEETKL